jgi:hypothetical protein
MRSQTGRSARGGAIVGQVTASGRPVVDAAVMFTRDSPEHPDIAALTGDGGEYRYDDLVPGVYTLLVHAEGYPPRTGQVRVQAGQQSRLDFSLG